MAAYRRNTTVFAGRIEKRDIFSGKSVDTEMFFALLCLGTVPLTVPYYGKMSTAQADARRVSHWVLACLRIFRDSVNNV